MSKHLSPVVLATGFLACLGGTTSAQDLGKPIQSPSARAQARGISHYEYHRSGPVVSVDVRGGTGSSLASLTLEWPDGQGAHMDCRTSEDRSFFINWRGDQGYARIEERDTGEGVEIQLVEGEWKIAGSDGRAPGHPFLRKNEDMIGFVIDVYEDALTNLGLRAWREQQMLRGMDQASEGEPGNLTLEKPSADVSGIAPKILCGLHACDGPVFTTTQEGLTRSSCCADATFYLGLDCGLFNPCPTCCHFTCTTSCAVGDYFCSCSGIGWSCGTPIQCDEEFPPPCT